ncbi:MAG: TetR/AcrR family transcriptional regulator [Acidimicrobiales bacterium]
MQPDQADKPRKVRRGRPPSYDREQVTAAALGLLWAQGFEATSVEQLSAATGLSTSSLYAGFGSKRGVLDAALDAYTTHMERSLAILLEGTAGVADVLRFIEHVRPATDPGAAHPGCFMVNTMTEVAPHDPDIAAATARYRSRIRLALESALRRAARRREIAPRSVPQRARMIQASLFGALVIARTGASDEASAALDALSAEIRRWRAPSPQP